MDWKNASMMINFVLFGEFMVVMSYKGSFGYYFEPPYPCDKFYGEKFNMKHFKILTLSTSLKRYKIFERPNKKYSGKNISMPRI